MSVAANKNINAEEAMAKLQRYCAYQERCAFDVGKKLEQWEIAPDEQRKIIAALRNDGFLSDERFAALYVRSKMNQKRWGRLRIRAELAQRKLPSEIIGQAIDHIDEAKYRENLQYLIRKKLNEIDTDDQQLRNLKLKQYLFSKGYEYDLIIEMIK